MLPKFEFFIILTAATSFVSVAEAAPLPPFPPVSICGAIVERSWSPTEIRRGQPGFSGSLGHRRTFPAHVRIVLENYTGIGAATAQRINRWLGLADRPDTSKRVLLLLPTDNPAFLAGVHSVCVEGFVIRGDEGGTWTRYHRVVPRRTE